MFQMICGAPLLLSLGIIQGYSDGAFQPNRDITQAQFAVIAIRFANETPGGTSLFSDANEDDWFCTQVTSAAQYGWIGGFSMVRSGHIFYHPGTGNCHR